MKNQKRTFDMRLSSVIKKSCRKCFLIVVFMYSVSAVIAQEASMFFGMNYWEYAVYNGVTTDKFKDYMPETSTWNLKIIRIGGNYPNINKNLSGDKDWYVTAIQNAKAIGGTPLVQLPINLPSTEVASWMDYFNVTKNLGVVYWGIGNEPDPSNGLDTWYAGTTEHDENTYVEFRGKFRAIARAIKAKDSNSIICGPDFRHWWGSVTDAATPFGGYYKDFLYGAGDYAVGTDDYNGDQLVDIFAFHFYGDGGSGNFDEGELSAKYAAMMTLINSTNALRPANQQLKIAVGEYNDNYNSTGFRVGQRMAIMAKQSLKNGAVYLTPWSLCEGNGWSMINKSTGVFYSAAHHYKMLAQNQRGNYMSSEVNNNYSYDIVPFGMQDANGYTIVLINEGATDYSFSVKFSTIAGNYSAGAGTLKFRFNANENIDFSNLILYKNSTLLFTFDAAGNMLKKVEYRSGYSAPVTTPYNVNTAPTVSFTAPTAGATFEAGTNVQLTANAADSDGTIAKVEFYDGAAATPFHTENQAPYDFGWTTFSTGAHTITAKAFDDDGATTNATRSFTIVNTLPTVSITAPANGTSVTSGTAITLTATSIDTAPGTVSSVSFYDGATLIGTDQSSPYSITWTGASVGTHSVTSRATDNNGGVGTSSPITITVTAISDPLTLSYFHLINKHSADYLRPKDGSNTALIVQDAEATVPTPSSFQWEFRSATTSGYYYIVNKWTGLAIQPTNGLIDESNTLSQIILTGNEGNEALQWVLEAVPGDNGYYWIKNRKSQKYIRPAGGSNVDLTNIVQNTIVDTTYPSYRWSLVNQGAKSGRLVAPGSEESEDANTSIVYPNPSADKITVVTQVENQSTVAILISDMSGKQFLSKEYVDVKGKFEKTFDISGFPAGVFVLSIKKGNGVEFKKVIKK